ncbi:MAG: 6-bladed beta-propeller [Bacteroidaceae bacterium]|nr:6-bladed beta-propeller [Bacteroidaceae bacterium]
MMKRLTGWILAGVLLTACQNNENPNVLMTIDLNQFYPEKELILQDFMEVEYVPLESSDEFITSATIKAVGEKYFVMASDRKLLLFDRHTGKGIRVINRVGQGAEEFTYAYEVVLDEVNNELIVNDPTIKKILVYDLEGNFKRSFKHSNEHKFVNVKGFDRDYLVCYDENIFMDAEKAEIDNSRSYHFLVSKQDGSIVQEIAVPYKKLNIPMIQEGGITSIGNVNAIMPLHNDMLIIQNSSDTIYRFTAKDHKTVPFLVKIPSSDPERLMTIGTVTPRYCFFQTIDKTFNPKTGRGFPFRELVYDKLTNGVYLSVVLNADYTSKQQVDMVRLAQNRTILCAGALQPHKLIEAYEKGELKGKLKEIASSLNEDSNPVLMILTAK